MQDQVGPTIIPESFYEKCCRTDPDLIQQWTQQNCVYVADQLQEFYQELEQSYKKTHSTEFSVTPIPETHDEAVSRSCSLTANCEERHRDLAFLQTTSRVSWEQQVFDYCDRLNRIVWIKLYTNCELALGHYLAKHPNCSANRFAGYKRRREAKRNYAYHSLHLDYKQFINNPELFYDLKPHLYHWDWNLHKIEIIH